MKPGSLNLKNRFSEKAIKNATVNNADILSKMDWIENEISDKKIFARSPMAAINAEMLKKILLDGACSGERWEIKENITTN